MGGGESFPSMALDTHSTSVVEYGGLGGFGEARGYGSAQVISGGPKEEEFCRQYEIKEIEPEEEEIAMTREGVDKEEFFLCTLVLLSLLQKITRFPISLLHFHLKAPNTDATTDPLAIPRPHTLLTDGSQVVNIFLDRAVALPFEQLLGLFASHQKKDRKVRYRRGRCLSRGQGGGLLDFSCDSRARRASH